MGVLFTYIHYGVPCEAESEPAIHQQACEQRRGGGQGISSSHPNLMSSSLSSSSTLRPRVCMEKSISISLMSILLLASSPFLLMELSIQEKPFSLIRIRGTLPTQIHTPALISASSGLL